MAILEYNEITGKKFIVFEGEPYEVLSSHVFRKQMRKPVNQTKLRHLISGRVVEHSFHAAEKAEEAELETRTIKYLYTAKGEFWFCEEKDPSQRFKLDMAVVGSRAQFMKPNLLVELQTFEDEIVGLKMPIKMDLKVTEAPPSIRGNTAQGGTKVVVLETGATVNAPLFVNEGDMIRVNTETGEYVERA
ncbi:elongation factor P [Candidatus Parcubacteria bacterium]|nr:elongation factor P [Candidatus Parcubacteria bacterium]